MEEESTNTVVEGRKAIQGILNGEDDRLIAILGPCSIHDTDAALEYALKYARDMTKELADQFVGMYVNDWTLDYGDRGRAAIAKLLDEGHRAGIIPSPVSAEFVV